MNIDFQSLRLPTDQYYSEPFPKSICCLHHSVGASAASSIEHWASNPDRIGAAYIIERDGTIYEVFPPDCWAYQYGIGNLSMERRSIGIELASEGGLTEKDGSLYAFDGKRLMGKTSVLVSGGAVWYTPRPYRGLSYFASYTEPQVEACFDLVVHLCDTFGIPRKMPLDVIKPRGNAGFWLDYQGIIHHAIVRADKSDLHLGFPFLQLARRLGDTDWNLPPIQGA